MMHSEMEVIEAPETAAAMLQPLRLEILSQLREPGSSTTVGKALDLPRQKVNYHIRSLEELGLVEEVGTRQRKGCTERLLQARSRSFLVSPSALGPVQVPSDMEQDRFSSAYLLATAARTLREVSTLRKAADEAGKKLATLTIDAEVHFESPADQARFLDDLSSAVTALARKYGRSANGTGRTYRLSACAHPAVSTNATTRRTDPSNPPGTDPAPSDPNAPDADDRPGHRAQAVTRENDHD